MSAPTYYPIVGDGFEPRLRGGRSGVLAVPVDRYHFEGLYVMQDGAIYRAERLIGSPTVRIWRDNPRYSVHEVPLHWFNAEVEAMGIAEVAIQVPDYQRFMRKSEGVRALAEQALLSAPAELLEAV
jgi:hypothetical protein